MKKLNILLLEDSKPDAELIKQELKKENLHFVAKRVDTRKDFIREIKSFRPDIILSDYNLPQYDGMSALKDTLTLDPQIPFIIVTGSLSEEVAAECIKSGACDYVVKERLFRLESAIKNALNIKKEKEKSKKVEETWKRYDFIINTSNIPMSLINKDLVYEAVNNAYCIQHDLHRNRIIGQSVTEIWKSTASIEKIIEYFKRAFQGEEIRYQEWFVTTKYGGRFYDVAFIPYYNEEHIITHVVVTSNDLTENKLAEIELQKLSAAVEQNPASIVITDLEGNIEYINPKFTELTGCTLKEVAGNKPDILKNNSTSPQKFRKLWKTITGGKVWKGEFRNQNKNGDSYWETVTISPITNSEGEILKFVIIKENITTRKKAEEKLKSSLLEKEIMLKEIHHRVKNNLQIISSLLHMQLKYVHDKNTYNCFLDSLNRIKSMALIHENLYQSDSLKDVDFSFFISKIILQLFTAYNINKDKISTKVNLSNVSLNINLAIPIGLIINELLTNSMKYAFPDNRSGEITIDFKYDQGKYTLIIADDGVGFPDDYDHNNSKSLGLLLVNALTRQVQGKLALESSKGTKFTLTFHK